MLGSSDCTGTQRQYSGKDGGAAFMLCKGSNDKQLYRVSSY